MKVKSSCSDIRQSLTLLSWVHFFLIRQHQKTLLLLYRGHIALRALVAELLLLLLVVGGCIGFCWPNGWCWKLSSRNGRREMQRKIALASASSSSSSYFVLPFSLGFFFAVPPSFYTYYTSFSTFKRSKKDLGELSTSCYMALLLLLPFENLKPVLEKLFSQKHSSSITYLA